MAATQVQGEHHNVSKVVNEGASDHPEVVGQGHEPTVTKMLFMITDLSYKYICFERSLIS